MGDSKLDLNAIKEQIKKTKHAIGATAQQKKKSRDVFLSELLHSRNSGQATTASEKIKIVETVSDKIGSDGKVPQQYSGNNVDPNLLAHVKTPTQNVKQPSVDMLPERNDKYDAQVNNLYTQYRNGASVAPTVPNQSGMLTEQQVVDLMAKQEPQQGGLITEQVGSAINNFINENMGVIVEQAMKNVVMEMYAIERIKKTLDENRDLIQKVVIDTIKMLSERKKTKTASGK